MQDNLVAQASIIIEAEPKKVWDALTKPDQVKEYFFGTEVITDWKVGNPIRWRGSWQGKTYEDKGTVVKVVPEKILQHTYWSSMGGREDKLENYVNVTYSLEAKDGTTLLTVVQDNNRGEAERAHSEKNWAVVLEAMKKYVEKSI